MIILLYYNDYDSTLWLMMGGAFRLLCNCCVILIGAKYIILMHSFIIHLPKIFLKISNEKQTTTSNFAGSSHGVLCSHYSSSSEYIDLVHELHSAMSNYC